MDEYSKNLLFEQNDIKTAYVGLPGYEDAYLDFDTGLHFRSLFSVHHSCLSRDLFADLRVSTSAQASSAAT